MKKQTFNDGNMGFTLNEQDIDAAIKAYIADTNPEVRTDWVVSCQQNPQDTIAISKTYFACGPKDPVRLAYRQCCKIVD